MMVLRLIKLFRKPKKQKKPYIVEFQQDEKCLRNENMEINQIQSAWSKRDPTLPTIVLVTGAAGNIGYHVIFAIARGLMLGETNFIELRLLEIPSAMERLEGVVMELYDCAFPLVTKIVATHDYKIAFADIDIALLIGSRPRGPGMERSDLIKANSKIFEGQGEALDKYAKK